MADISITAASVAPGSGDPRQSGISGATITAGVPLYKDSTDSDKLKLVDVDNSDATALTVGIAVGDAVSGQVVSYQTGGSVTYNAVLTKGVIYVGSDTAGGVKPSADLGSGDRVVILGTASSTTVLKLGLNNTGITV